jgi:hypothetical protein
MTSEAPTQRYHGREDLLTIDVGRHIPRPGCNPRATDLPTVSGRCVILKSTRLPVERLSLKRSQLGRCFTKYDNPTRNSSTCPAIHIKRQRLAQSYPEPLTEPPTDPPLRVVYLQLTWDDTLPANSALTHSGGWQKPGPGNDFRGSDTEVPRTRGTYLQLTWDDTLPAKLRCPTLCLTNLLGN